MLAAAGEGIGRREEEGAGTGLVKDRQAHPRHGVREEGSLAGRHSVESGVHLHLAQLTHQGQLPTVLGERILRHVPQGVDAAIGKEIYGQGAAHVLLLALLLGDEGGVGRGECKGLQRVFAHLVALDVGELAHLQGLQVNDGQGVLGHVIGLFLVYLGPARLGEIRLDEAHGVGIVVQYGEPIPAGDFHHPVLFFAADAEGERAVSFLRVHFIRDDASGRGDNGVGHCLPTVEDSVVQRLFLGLQSQGEQDAGEKKVFFHYLRWKMYRRRFSAR